MIPEIPVFEEIGFIAVLLVAIAFIHMVFGAEVTYSLLWLILLGQIFVNWEILDKTVKEVMR